MKRKEIKDYYEFMMRYKGIEALKENYEILRKNKRAFEDCGSVFYQAYLTSLEVLREMIKVNEPPKKEEINLYSIPVEWAVRDRISVFARSLEEAIEFVKAHQDEIPLGDNPEYIEGSWSIYEDDEFLNTELLVDLLESLGVVREFTHEIDFREVYNAYKDNWKEKHINSKEPLLSYEEFLESKVIDIMNHELVEADIDEESNYEGL